MKIRLLIAALLCVSPLFAQAQYKFGHLNSEAFLGSMPEVSEIQKTLDAESAKVESQLTVLQEDFKKMQDEFEKNSQTMNDQQKAQSANELQETYQKIQSYIQLSRQQLQTKSQELYAPLLQKVRAAVEEVGLENNFIYIFEQQGAALYNSSKSIDVSDLVKAKLTKK